MQKEILLVIICLGLTQCRPEKESTVRATSETSRVEAIDSPILTPAQEEIVMPDPTITPLVTTPLATRTALLPRETLTPTMPTATPTPNTPEPSWQVITELESSCIDLSEVISSDPQVLNESLILTTKKGNDAELSLVVPDSIKVLPDSLSASVVALDPFRASTSLDGRWLESLHLSAFDENGEVTLMKATALDMTTGESHVLELDGLDAPLEYSHFTWLTPRHLLMRTLPLDSQPELTFVFWSPLENDKRLFSVTMPGFEHRLSNNQDGIADIDPLFEYIAYPCYSELCNGDNYRVLDMKTGEIIWSVKDIVSWFYPVTPAWSPNGEYLFLVGKNSIDSSTLYIFRRNGELAFEIIIPNMTISDYQWSAASNRIGFQLFQNVPTNSELSESSFGYIDLEQMTLYSFCDLPEIAYFRWSPDGQKVTIEYTVYDDLGDAGIETFHRAFVLDLVSKTSSGIYEGAFFNFIAGWVQIRQ